MLNRKVVRSARWSGVAALVLATLPLATAGHGVAASALDRAPSGQARAAAAAAPVAGPIFANAHDGTGDAILDRIVANINATPSYGQIRVASMTFTDMKVADALAAAALRGVDVRVVVARKTCSEDAIARLRWRAIPVTCAVYSARGSDAYTSGTQHIKAVSFSETGGKKEVVIVTSSNLTAHAREFQANDAYQTVGWSTFYSFWLGTHNQLMADKPVTNPFRTLTEGVSQVYVNPNNPGQTDPVVNRINALPTRNLVIRISMSALLGARAGAIADALIAKARAGARIVYIDSSPTDGTAEADMKRAGIQFRNYDWNDSAGEHHFHHHKFMTASWDNAAGARVYRTWMGSEVWTPPGRIADEIVLRLGSSTTHNAYVTYFNKLWSLSTPG